MEPLNEEFKLRNFENIGPAHGVVARQAIEVMTLGLIPVFCLAKQKLSELACSGQCSTFARKPSGRGGRERFQPAPMEYTDGALPVDGV